MNEEKQRLLAIIRELYGRVCWSHKTHEKERELSTQRAKRDRWINVVLMALTTTGILASIPLENPWATITAALLAAISTGFAIYQISFSTEIEVYRQRQAAKSLLLERERLVLLIERVMADDANIQDIRKVLETTIERIGQIYSSSPDTSDKLSRWQAMALNSMKNLPFPIKK